MTPLRPKERVRGNRIWIHLTCRAARTTWGGGSRRSCGSPQSPRRGSFQRVAATLSTTRRAAPAARRHRGRRSRRLDLSAALANLLMRQDFRVLRRCLQIELHVVVQRLLVPFSPHSGTPLLPTLRAARASRRAVTGRPSTPGTSSRFGSAGISFNFADLDAPEYHLRLGRERLKQLQRRARPRPRGSAAVPCRPLPPRTPSVPRPVKAPIEVGEAEYVVCGPVRGLT